MCQITYAPSSLAAYAGLDLLTSAVVILDDQARVEFANNAAETLLDFSAKSLTTQQFSSLFVNAALLDALLEEAQQGQFSNKRMDLVLERFNHEPLQLHVIITVLADNRRFPVILEFQEIDQQVRVDREIRMLDQMLVNRELIRNLAHEIKNPLGGIRGAAQLLEMELAAPDYREYTQVIIKEVDRLKTLVDQLLAPHRRPQIIVGSVNIHEVCERVRSVILAEYPKGLTIVRDYDVSTPDLIGDKEQLIQALLNITRNAAQALKPQVERGQAIITIKTRVARQITIAKKRYRLALELHIIDNGPGIAPDIQERIFFPLVSGRQGGTGLGLTLAQTFIQEHHGAIDCESIPGKTDFKIVLPLETPTEPKICP